MEKYRKDKPTDLAGSFMTKININSAANGNTQSQKQAILLLLETKPISNFWITRIIALRFSMLMIKFTTVSSIPKHSYPMGLENVISQMDQYTMDNS
jgi:hypothetical protein